MKTLEYKTEDKSSWGPGPWQHEPDKRQWKDEATSLPCMIVRGPHGGWCGYVGVTKEHPCFGSDYDGEKIGDVEVHGGLTFASQCTDMSRDRWEKMRAEIPRHEQTARMYPRGDSAVWLKEYLPVLDDYDSWVGHMQATAICHLVEPCEDDDVFWFGFDCAHAFDLAPKYVSFRTAGAARDETYRDIEYVVSEVESLARQLAEKVA